MIELKGGEGTIVKRIPAMLRMFLKHGIDMRKEPILVYPTLHYQNGGLHITTDARPTWRTSSPPARSWAASTAANRLMGNSLLDIIVFGRNAGVHAAQRAKTVTVGKLNMDHVYAYEAERAAAGIGSEAVLPETAARLHPQGQERDGTVRGKRVEINEPIWQRDLHLRRCLFDVLHHGHSPWWAICWAASPSRASTWGPRACSSSPCCLARCSMKTCRRPWASLTAAATPPRR